MAFKLGESTNRLVIHDNLSNTDIEFFYRTPTPAERQKYGKAKQRIKKGNMQSNVVELCIAGAKAILTGIGEECFSKRKNGKDVFISSDVDSPLYDPDWKKLIHKYASHLLHVLGLHVFYNAAEVDDDDADDDDFLGELETEESSTE